MLEIKTVTNGPTSKQGQRVCHDTLPWLISFSLDVSATTDENIDISADSCLVAHYCFRSGAASAGTEGSISG